MPVFEVTLKSTLDGVAKLVASPSFNFRIKFECTRCRQPTGDRPVVFSWSDEEPIPGSRGTANVIVTCKECKSVSSVSILSTISDAAVVESDKSAVWGKLECRGVIPSASELGVKGITVIGASGVEWVDADVAGGDFCEYDEGTEASITVSDLEMGVRPAAK